uniref:Perforin-1-like n=1 Tax=Chrysemys picta bellii TaxID=8478 RepID=A0A8C3FUV0_CHRPI
MPRFGAFIPLLLFLLFIFPGATSNCHTSTENECKKLTAFVPGHSLIGEGIDVTTMGRKGAYLVDSSLWQHEDGTCTLCQNRLQGGQWQRLPLAVVDWRVHVSCRRKLSSSVQQSAMGMMESAASAVQNDWKVGLDVPVKPKVNVQVALAGSRSKLASFVVDHTRMDKYSFMSQKRPRPLLLCLPRGYHDQRHVLLAGTWPGEADGHSEEGHWPVGGLL